MSAPALRAAVRAVLDQLDDDVKDSVIDTLMTRGTKARSGWRPARPSARVVEEARSFADAARHMRRRLSSPEITRAPGPSSKRSCRESRALTSISASTSSSRRCSESTRGCVAQYAASVFITTPLGERADAIIRALEQVEGVGTLSSPITDMEDVCAGALPDLGAFLPLWVKRLERCRPSKDEWETEHERWLREVVYRADGVEGLERIARKTRRPQSCLAWCDALVDRGDWTAVMSASDVAARLVCQSHWRGEILDRRALAAQELGRPDLSRRLEAAWRAAPTLPRLLRWLAADGHERAAIRAKATKALPRCPKTAARQIGLLRALAGDVSGAAAVLARSLGLGWSNPDHPGHTLFPLLATLLSNGTIGDALVSELETTSRDPLESFAMTDEEHKPTLTTPAIVPLIQNACSSVALNDPDRDAVLDAMRVAAEKRVEGILGNSRRRHYGHAALLVAACVAYASQKRATEILRWAVTLRQQHWRRHAFREELARACGSLGVSIPA